MDIQTFIDNVADQFDMLSVELTPETRFRDLDEWTSLTALLIITMIDDEYDIVLSPEEMRKTHTLQELYDIVASKQ
jgi:acyl carrier protein